MNYLCSIIEKKDGLMVASVAGLPVLAVYCKVQLLRQSAFTSTMAVVYGREEILSAAAAIGAAEYRRSWFPSDVFEYGGQLFKRKCKSQVEPRCMVKVGDPYGFL